jgi:hypothetical protein
MPRTIPVWGEFMTHLANETHLRVIALISDQKLLDDLKWEIVGEIARIQASCQHRWEMQSMSYSEETDEHPRPARQCTECLKFEWLPKEE